MGRETSRQPEVKIRQRESLNQKTHQSTCDCHEMCVLFQDHIIDNFRNLESTSKYPGTPTVTEERQFGERSLTHISDEAYVFFLR